MIKVYVLTDEPKNYDEDRAVVAVFSSRELAQEWVAKYCPEYIHCSNATYGQLAYDIQEYTLD